MLKPLLSKVEIMSWYERAKLSALLRSKDAHPVLWKISAHDRDSYLRSIEAHFKCLKQAFNARLRAKKPTQDW